MKRWLFVPLLSLALSTPSFAQTSTEYQREQILLSYEEFAQLTHAEQKTYVKKLREIMIEVSKAYPEMAAEMSNRSTFFAQLKILVLKDAIAQDDNNDVAVREFIDFANSQAQAYIQAVEKTKVEKLTDSQRGIFAAQYRESFFWSAASAQYAHSLKSKSQRENALASLAATKEKIEKAETKVKTAVDESEYRQARDDYFKKAHSGQLMLKTPYPEQTLLDFGQRLPASALAAPAKKEEKKAETAKPEIKKESKPAAPVAEKKTETPPTAKSAEEKTADSNGGVFYRCMYAGFVIKNHPCMAPSELPWDLKGIDTSKFTCSKGTVMCNPFLFGFKSSCDWSKTSGEESTQECYSKAQPYCVRPGLYATKNCGEASNKDSALEAAVRLIHDNAATFNLYSNSFGDLCNKHLINFNSYKGQLKPQNTARTKADIKRTCDSARTRMKEIRRRYSLFRDKQPKKEAPAPQPPTETETKGAK